MGYETILYDVDDQVAIITLNRPEQLNAWGADMAGEVGQALATARDDDDIRVVVITGAGRAFCSGAGLAKDGTNFESKGEVNSHRLGTPDPMPWDLPKPVVAAINGHAVGVGLTFPLSADLRFVAEDAKLQFAFNRRGIVPELASPILVPRIIGLQAASDLMLSGRFFSGAEAAELGMARKALPADQVLPAALEWAHDTAKNTAPLSVALTKELMWRSLRQEANQMFEHELFLIPWTGATPDAREGITSFLQKRPPVWTGRISKDLPDF